MKADITRSTFRSRKHYHGVLMQQGRVQVDADWNESQDIGSYLDETTRIDVIGRRGTPKVGGGFAIGIAPGGVDLTISAGRLYVDGLLCELDGSAVVAAALEADAVEVEELVVDDRPFAAGDWIEVGDPAGTVAPQLVRVMSVAAETRTLGVKPDLATTAIENASIRRVASYTTQPDLPSADLVAAATERHGPQVELADGTYLAYLDAWLRHITDLDDPGLQEPALGGIDTTTRTRTIAQVRLRHLGPTLLTDCAAVPPLPDLLAGSTETGDRPPTTGRLAARARPADESDDLCVIPADARYRGIENQLYRVEVHDPGELDAATFKWSRENGSIAVLWTGQTGDRLTVSSTGRDAVLGFASDQLVELTDDTIDLHGRPGKLVTLQAPPADDELRVDPAAAVQRADFPRNPKIRRWDSTAAATVEVGPGDGYLALEDGIEVRFEAGWYNTGDYWLIPARTATRDVDWPRDLQGRPLAVPPAGIAHHYAPLALVEVVGSVPTAVHDCRDPFPALTAISADDVSFDNDACRIPGARTVQDALDSLCESSSLRRHKKHLHGWGIACGLRVTCGIEGDAAARAGVTVEDGYAIDCDGNDLLVERDRPIDLDRLMEPHGGRDAFLADGAGDLSLFMRSDVERGIVYDVEKYDPNSDQRKNPLAGDLLNDVYKDCIEPIQQFLEKELGLGKDRDRGKGAQRQSILASLVAQVLNPRASQTIHVAPSEHEIMLAFYRELRALLQSETFCAMFDEATEFPAYPADMPEMDTIFSMGHHQRIRIRPGNREAWTVGGGLNPVTPSSFVNRFDLRGRVLLERLAPIAGTIVGDTEPDSGSGPISDVAFSPDGSRVYVVAPTTNGENTLFRSGRIEDRGVAWGELVTICDVHLVTLATTRADPDVVYAIGSRAGLYRIDPGAVDPSMAASLAFPASGHLVLTPEGRGYATSIQNGATAALPTYDRLVGFTAGASIGTTFDVVLPATGRDDLAVGAGAPPRSRRPSRRAPEGPGTVYVATDGPGGGKRILAYDARSGEPLTKAGAPVAIDLADGPIRLASFAPTGMLLVVSEDDCLVEIVDMSSNELVVGAGLPVQVGPVAVATTDEPGFAYVLNYWSDTITVLPADVLTARYRFPFKALAVYRRQIIHAFRDLLAGFVQYLKDCLCDHLLVACPDCDGDGRIYLASVSIRKERVYKVCNFSRRKYVKSFPTVDYWLSIVPIMPLITKAVEEFCCMVLPDLFGRYTVPEYEPTAERQAPRYRYSEGRAQVETAQGTDFKAKFKDVTKRTTLAASLVADAGRRTLGQPAADPAVRIANLVGQPTDHAERSLADRGIGVVRSSGPGDDLTTILGNVLGFLRTPRPGDEVTLHEEGGTVRYMTVAEPGRTAAADEAAPSVVALSKAVEARDAEVAELRLQVQRLEQAAQPAADEARIAGLEAELRELRGLRDDVTRLLGSDRPAGATAKPSATRATATTGPAAAKPTARRATPKSSASKPASAPARRTRSRKEP